ncbi:MAG: primosomal protein N', partial [Microcystaceae cyanobacterium]
TEKQQEVLTVLRHQGGECWLQELMALVPCSLGVIENLATKGLVVISHKEQLRLLAHPDMPRDRPQCLTPDQQKALDVLHQLTGFQIALLHGVTGSGKTEVYLQAIAPILNTGKSVLILVPEIGLAPQLTDRFRARFGDQVLVYHSALSDGERYDTWRKMLAVSNQIVIGTRSAVFVPLGNLGLIILDEEHDSSFKQQQLNPPYHARTVAQWRAELENCPLILGSATPSLETWQQIHTAPAFPPVHYLTLPERVNTRPLPAVTLVDMREELKAGNRSIFSRQLQTALAQLTPPNQAILFISRRGHSTFVSCRSCGFVLECPHCDVSLSYHDTKERSPLLRCHYCNYNCHQPRFCPSCQSPYLKFFGSGTQKVTETLTEEFPHLRWLRFDSDTTRKKGEHRRLLDRFRQGEADILVGTQMLTKGLDVAQVVLVGVVAADSLLHFADYRATERAFQTLTQVAGRAGRGEETGQILIQSYSPQHPVLQAVKHHHYQAFLE